MPDKAFFDTNVLIYAVAENDPRGPRAEALFGVRRCGWVQVLNEFVAVVRRKLRMPWRDGWTRLTRLRRSAFLPIFRRYMYLLSYIRCPSVPLGNLVRVTGSP